MCNKGGELSGIQKKKYCGRLRLKMTNNAASKVRLEMDESDHQLVSAGVESMKLTLSLIVHALLLLSTSWSES